MTPAIGLQKSEFSERVQLFTANGPAIKGGCVPAFFPKKRDGVVFAVQLHIS
jgi:hypothetical protein